MTQFKVGDEVISVSKGSSFEGRWGTIIAKDVPESSFEYLVKLHDAGQYGFDGWELELLGSAKYKDADAETFSVSKWDSYVSLVTDEGQEIIFYTEDIPHIIELLRKASL